MSLSYQSETTDIPEHKFCLAKILLSSFNWTKDRRNKNDGIRSLEPFMKVQPDIEVQFGCEGVRVHKFILYYRCYHSETVRSLLLQNNLTNMQVKAVFRFYFAYHRSAASGEVKRRSVSIRALPVHR
jgi:hypothetical protein